MQNDTRRTKPRGKGHLWRQPSNIEKLEYLVEMMNQTATSSAIPTQLHWQYSNGYCYLHEGQSCSQSFSGWWLLKMAVCFLNSTWSIVWVPASKPFVGRILVLTINRSWVFSHNFYVVLFLLPLCHKMDALRRFCYSG